MDDTTFVVENEVKRRSPLLAIAKGTTTGREFVQKLTDHVKTILENAKELELVADKIDEYVKKIQAETTDRTKLLETLRKSAHAKIEDWVGKNVHGTDEAALAKQVADSVVDAIFDEVARHLDDPDVDHAAAWIARVTQAAKRHLDQATAVLDYFDRYGVDEGGIYESAKIIVGLADADRRTTIDFENVKPSLVQFPGEASGGTAATLIGDDINAKGELGDVPIKDIDLDDLRCLRACIDRSVDVHRWFDGALRESREADDGERLVPRTGLIMSLGFGCSLVWPFSL